MTCPDNPFPEYKPLTDKMTFYSDNFTDKISTTKPSWPTAVQGLCFSNCPLMGALASVAWVNRNFIRKNISGPDAFGKYTFTFWDYPKLTTCVLPKDPTSGIQLNTTDAYGNPAGIPVQVKVSPHVLQDGKLNASDANGISYGAGSSNAGEIWPALYERAYGKFCMYTNGLSLKSSPGNPLTINDMMDTTRDPMYSDLQHLTTVQWGGNAGISLVHLTGRNCFAYSTTSAAFTALGGLPAGATGGSLYTFIKAGFCSENAFVRGLNKTRYPLVAMTYASEDLSPVKKYDRNSNPDGILYDSTTILANHCYPVLGTFDSADGKHYIVFRTTFGLMDPARDFPASNFLKQAQTPNSTWRYYDAQFKLGTTAQYPTSTAVKISLSLDLAITGDAIFGLEEGLFKNYFSMISWAQGY